MVPLSIEQLLPISTSSPISTEPKLAILEYFDWLVPRLLPKLRFISLILSSAAETNENPSEPITVLKLHLKLDPIVTPVETLTPLKINELLPMKQLSAMEMFVSRKVSLPIVTPFPIIQ